jgi:hypothetical protein
MRGRGRSDLEEAEHLALWVPQPILCGLRRRATLKGISEVALAEMLLKTIVEDDLYEAVLRPAAASRNETGEASADDGTRNR